MISSLFVTSLLLLFIRRFCAGVAEEGVNEQGSGGRCESARTCDDGGRRRVERAGGWERESAALPTRKEGLDGELEDGMGASE